MRDRETLKLSSAIALAYAVFGILALQFAIPPGKVSLLFPPAGIALAALLLFGNRVWPAVSIGSLAVNLFAMRHGGIGSTYLNALIVPVGATLQALAGAWMVRRWTGFPGEFDNPRSILLFLFVCAPLSCTISPSFAIPLLVASGALTPGDAVFNWSSWWAGDTLGLLIACPLMLSVLGRTSPGWQSRRRTFVVPMAAALLLIATLILQVNQWERLRVRSLFAGEASHLSSLVRTRLGDHLDALQATQDLMSLYPETRRSAFSSFASTWLSRQPGIFALGWAPRVSDAERSHFEQAMRRDGLPDYRINERDADGRLHPARHADVYFPVAYNEPADRNRHSLGLNPLTSFPASAAIRDTLRRGGPAASNPQRLTQDAERQTGIMVYQAVFAHGENKAGPVLGLVVMGLRMGDLLHVALDSKQLDGISYCLSDITSDDQSKLLGGTPDCPAGPRNAFSTWSEDFKFAGRTLRLSLHAGEQYFAAHRSWAAWTLLALGLVSIGLLSAFLLLNSGRARKVAELVAERTSQLEAATSCLRAQQTMLAHAQSIARLGSWEADPVSGIGAWSEELFRILGLEPRPVGQLADLAEALHPQDRPHFQRLISELTDSMPAATLDARLVHADGEERAVRIQMEAERRKGQLLRLRGTVQDITSVRDAEEQIRNLAQNDSLTGLPNRAQWLTRANQMLAAARRHGHHLAVLFIDLDHFKKVNDSLGHPVGDRLLITAAQRFQGCLRDEDVLARLGGDEFVALISQLVRPEDAGTVAHKMLTSLTRPFSLEGHEMTVSASIGVALFPSDGQDIDTLVKHADTAMYSAKGSGRNDYCFFTPEMNARAFERLSMENALRHALQRGRLSLEYQPQWLLPEGRIAGVEALLRWRDPDRGLVSPTRFVPVAEEGGLIHPMGEWVLREAFRQSAAWQRAGLPHCVTAVNISALQFRRPGFLDLLRDILTETGADPRNLELELTETTLMRPDEEAMMQLHALRSMGFGLALDDFGTGYSSLAYLKRLPITRLKIDRSFVQDLPGDAEDAAVATATLSIARDLGLEVVAEGVETIEQRNFLIARGCRVMQGFLFSKPLPADAVTRLLTTVG